MGDKKQKKIRGLYFRRLIKDRKDIKNNRLNNPCKK